MNCPVRRLGFYNTASATEHYLGIRWPRAIWQAVLEQAIADAVEGPDMAELLQMPAHEVERFGEYIRLAAREWINDDTNEPRRFAWVCEQLDLEHSAVRAAIKRRVAA